MANRTDSIDRGRKVNHPEYTVSVCGPIPLNLTEMISRLHAQAVMDPRATVRAPVCRESKNMAK